MSKRKKLIPKPTIWENTESRTRLLRPVSHDNGSGLAGNNESLWGSGCGDGEVLEDMSEGNETAQVSVEEWPAAKGCLMDPVIQKYAER